MGALIGCFAMDAAGCSKFVIGEWPVPMETAWWLPPVVPAGCLAVLVKEPAQGVLPWTASTLDDRGV